MAGDLPSGWWFISHAVVSDYAVALRERDTSSSINGNTAKDVSQVDDRRL